MTAFGLTALAGLGDELWQGILPNRHFDWRDVRLNGSLPLRLSDHDPVDAVVALA